MPTLRSDADRDSSPVGTPLYARRGFSARHRKREREREREQTKIVVCSGTRVMPGWQRTFIVRIRCVMWYSELACCFDQANCNRFC